MFLRAAAILLAVCVFIQAAEGTLPQNKSGDSEVDAMLAGMFAKPPAPPPPSPSFASRVWSSVKSQAATAAKYASAAWSAIQYAYYAGEEAAGYLSDLYDKYIGPIDAEIYAEWDYYCYLYDEYIGPYDQALSDALYDSWDWVVDEVREFFKKPSPKSPDWPTREEDRISSELFRERWKWPKKKPFEEYAPYYNGPVGGMSSPSSPSSGTSSPGSSSSSSSAGSSTASAAGISASSESVSATSVTPASAAPTSVAPTDIAPTAVSPTDVAPTDITPTDISPTNVTGIPPGQTLNFPPPSPPRAVGLPPSSSSSSSSSKSGRPAKSRPFYPNKDTIKSRAEFRAKKAIRMKALRLKRVWSSRIIKDIKISPRPARSRQQRPRDSMFAPHVPRGGGRGGSSGRSGSSSS